MIIMSQPSRFFLLTIKHSAYVRAAAKYIYKPKVFNKNVYGGRLFN